MAQNPPEDDGSPVVTIDDVALPVGHFRFYFADELWEWSPETAQMHGYRAVEMNPTTDQVMSHKHPEDRERMAAVLDHVRRTQAALSTRHRIITVGGEVRDIVAVGMQLVDQERHVIGNEGFYIDVTSTTGASVPTIEDVVTAKLTTIVQSRTVVDEVKGMLMLIYRIDDRRAFEVLRWRSQATNTKLRALAEQFHHDVAALDYDRIPPRSVFDQLLLTAHERVDDS